jgi:hypothetical protein
MPSVVFGVKTIAGYAGRQPTEGTPTVRRCLCRGRRQLSMARYGGAPLSSRVLPNRVLAVLANLDAAVAAQVALEISPLDHALCFEGPVTRSWSL